MKLLCIMNTSHTFEYDQESKIPGGYGSYIVATVAALVVILGFLCFLRRKKLKSKLLATK
jgi:uncharacterized membrane protein